MAETTTKMIGICVVALLLPSQSIWNRPEPWSLGTTDAHIEKRSSSIYPGLHTHTQPSSTLGAKLIAELWRYAELPNGWDGEGSMRADPISVGNAKNIIGQMPDSLKPSPMLSRMGVVGLYWDLPFVYAELEFEGDGYASLYLRHRSDKALDYFEENLPIVDLTPEFLADRLSESLSLA